MGIVTAVASVKRDRPRHLVLGGDSAPCTCGRIAATEKVAALKKGRCDDDRDEHEDAPGHRQP
jgi:hypothetical protein